MPGVIWKLSALATVVGLGLVGVVTQRGGFGTAKGTPTAAITAKEAPVPKIPGQKKNEPTELQLPAEAGDPFGGESKQADAGSENAPQQLTAEVEDAPPEELATTTRTRSRTRGRNRNAAVQPVETDTANQEPQELASSNENDNSALVTEAETAAGPPRPGLVRQSDPAEMEGTLPQDQDTNHLVEEDPFPGQRSANTAARTSTRGNPARPRPSINEPEQDVLAQGPRTEQNPFDNGTEVAAEPRPPMPNLARARSRARLIENNEPPSDVPVAPAAAEVVVDQIASEPQLGTPNQFETDTVPRSQVSPGKSGRPQMRDEDDAFGPGGRPPVGKSGATSPRQEPGLGARPQGLVDDVGENAPPPPGIPSGAQPIPQINRGASDTDYQMPPPAARGNRRPNSLAEDGDEGPAPRSPQPSVPQPTVRRGPNEVPDSPRTGPRGGEPDPQITDSAIPVPNDRRPASKYVLEVDPNNPPSGLMGQQPEGTASRNSRTEVIAAPQRLNSGADFPGSPGGSRGRPKVTIEKRAPATAYVGQPLIYHIVIRNVGNGPAQQVVVQDIVPDGVAMQGSIPQAELVAKKLSWKIGTLAVGEERKISVKVIPGAEGAVGSAATVNFLADPAMYASNAEPEAMVPATPVGGSATGGLTGPRGVPTNNRTSTTRRNAGNVTLDIQGPKQVGVGQPFDIRFLLTNRTNQPLSGIMIRKTLAGGLQHESLVQDLEYRVGDMAPAERREVTITLTGMRSGRSISKVEIRGSDGQVLQSQDYSVDVGALGNQSGSADLPVTLERLGSTRPLLKRPTAYANRLTNRGTKALKRLRVAETIPQGMEFVSAGDGGQYDPATRQVVWNVEKLDPKAATDLEISLTTTVKNPPANSVVVEDGAGHQLQTLAQVAADGAPMLSVEVVPPTGPIQVGDPVVYEIRLTNKGSEVVEQAAVRLSVPDALKLAKAGPLNSRQEGSDLVFDAIPALQPGRQALLTVEFVAQSEGDTRLKVQYASAHMKTPMSRDEPLQIAANTRGGRFQRP